MGIKAERAIGLTENAPFLPGFRTDTGSGRYCSRTDW